MRAFNFKDITGKQFGELTVIEIDEEKSLNSKRGIYWKCICSCGNKKTIWGAHLRSGSIVTCGNRSVHRLKENNSNWRGGTTSEIQIARSGRKYGEWRNRVYALDYYTCQCCLKNNKIKKEAHHIRNFADNKNCRYDVNNGITMCYDCHSMYQPDSFHHTYGTRNNTPEQLETYINNKRKKLGILIPFSIDEYIRNKNIMKLNNLLLLINSDEEDFTQEEFLDYEEVEYEQV